MKFSIKKAEIRKPKNITIGTLIKYQKTRNWKSKQNN